jgi:hypothetical protein
VNVRSVVLAAVFGAGIAPAAAARQTTSAALVDRELTVGAGASIAATLGEAVAHVEDAFVPHRLFLEEGPVRRTANVTYRLLKLAFVDAPQEQWLLVVNHELFGHGARVRERFDGPVGYKIAVPQPYGGGGGSTSFIFDREPSPHELLSIHVGGMEASGVAAELLASRAIARGSMTARDALRYLGFELDTLTYVLSTDAVEERGHDVADFLDVYNGLAADVGASPLPRRTLQRDALVGLANPMLAYAVWGLGRYIATGSSDVAVPMLTIGGVRYLPLARFRLTPFGTEWSLVNELGGRERSTRIELRVGRAFEDRPWGVSVLQRALPVWREWTVDLAVNLWRQPRFAEAPEDPFPPAMRLGAHLRGRVEIPLVPVWFSADRATFIVDVGLKSSGFVAGEPLAGGVVMRAGVGLPLGR